MSRKKRRPDPADPFPLISWDGVPEEESVGIAVVDAPPPAEIPAVKETPAVPPSRKERKEKRKKERAAASAPATTPLPRLRAGFDSRFFFRAVLVLGAAAAAAILVSVVWLRNRPEIPAPPAEVSFAAPAIANSIEDLEKSLTKDAEPDSAGLAFGYRPGDILSYNFEFVQNLNVGLNAAFMETAQRRGGSVTASQIRDVRLGWRLGGRADLAVYEAGEKIVVGWRFSTMSLDLRGDAADAVAAAPGERAGTLEALRAELNREALVTMTRRGAIEGVAFAKGTTPWVQALLSAVVLTARVTLPETPVVAWRATEADATGKYVADYAAEGGLSTADGKTSRIARTKAGYEQLACQSPAGAGTMPAEDAKASLEGGSVVLWNSANGRFRTFRVDEKLRLEGKEFAQTVTSSTAGGMRFASAARDENLAANGSSMAKAFREGGEGLQPGGADIAARLASQAEGARLRGLTGGMSIDDAIARLEKLAATDQLDSAEAEELVDRLAAILKLDDAAVSVALEVILQGTAHPAVRVALTDALGAAETPRSLQALLEVAGNNALEPDIRGNAFSGLAMADAPPAGAEAAARAAATFGTPSAEPALLALGMLSRKADAARAEELAETLKSLGRASSDPDWQSLYLESIGNAGLPGSLGEVEKFLAADDVHTRARATFALRFVGGNRADELLASARTDASPQVRLAAIAALGFREGPAAKAMLEEATRDTDPKVRAAAEKAVGSR